LGISNKKKLKLNYKYLLLKANRSFLTNFKLLDLALFKRALTDVLENNFFFQKKFILKIKKKLLIK